MKFCRVKAQRKDGANIFPDEIILFCAMEQSGLISRDSEAYGYYSDNEEYNIFSFILNSDQVYYSPEWTETTNFADGAEGRFLAVGSMFDLFPSPKDDEVLVRKLEIKSIDFLTGDGFGRGVKLCRIFANSRITPYFTAVHKIALVCGVDGDGVLVKNHEWVGYFYNGNDRNKYPLLLKNGKFNYNDELPEFVNFADGVGGRKAEKGSLFTLFLNADFDDQAELVFEVASCYMYEN